MECDDVRLRFRLLRDQYGVAGQRMEYPVRGGIVGERNSYDRTIIALWRKGYATEKKATPVGTDVAGPPSPTPNTPISGEPLAARMRPRTLDEIVGQEHLV